MLSESWVDEHKEEIKGALKEYIKICGVLANGLLEVLGLDKSSLNGELRFHIDDDRQEGRIDDNWSYFLHGSGCRFTSEEGQEVEINFNELGSKDIDPYFFSKFIKTSKKYPEVAKVIHDEFMDMNFIFDKMDSL